MLSYKGQNWTHQVVVPDDTPSIYLIVTLLHSRLSMSQKAQQWNNYTFIDKPCDSPCSIPHSTPPDYSTNLKFSRPNFLYITITFHSITSLYPVPAHSTVPLDCFTHFFYCSHAHHHLVTSLYTISFVTYPLILHILPTFCLIHLLPSMLTKDHAIYVLQQRA